MCRLVFCIRKLFICFKWRKQRSRHLRADTVRRVLASVQRTVQLLAVHTEAAKLYRGLLAIGGTIKLNLNVLLHITPLYQTTVFLTCAQHYSTACTRDAH